MQPRRRLTWACSASHSGNTSTQAVSSGMTMNLKNVACTAQRSPAGGRYRQRCRAILRAWRLRAGGAAGGADRRRAAAERGADAVRFAPGSLRPGRCSRGETGEWAEGAQVSQPQSTGTFIV